jgi:hypothetical protein
MSTEGFAIDQLDPGLPAVDVALADIRAQRTACFRLLSSRRPCAEAVDVALEEIARLNALETWWLDNHGTDSF